MLKKLKLPDKLSVVISIIAIAISLGSTYFQFFNKRHKILYSTLEPDFNNQKQTIIIPILFKNLGNQTEVILDTNLKLEAREGRTSFFRILPLQTETGFPLILAPSESKLIKLSGSYKEYLLGSFEISNKNEFIFHQISILDSLKLIAEIRYITTSGVVGNNEKEIGFMSFNKKKEFERIDCNPIKLKRLPIRRNDFHILYYSKSALKSNVTVTLDLKDSTLNDKLILIHKLISDSTLIK